MRPTIENGSSIQPFEPPIRLLYSRPTKLSIQAVTEHVELKQIASRLQAETGTALPLPSYGQVWDYILTLKHEPPVQKKRGQEKDSQRSGQSPLSFALSIPAPAQLPQADDHTMERNPVTKIGLPFPTLL